MLISFMEAIAKMEGYYVAGSRSQRNANPGDLNFEPWLAQQYGAVLETIPAGFKDTPRFARFPSAQAGWTAMRQLLVSDYLDMTIEAALNKWAPPSDGNDVSDYLDGVLEFTGLTASTVLTEALIGAPPTA